MELIHRPCFFGSARNEVRHPMKCATEDEPNETARDLLGGLKATAGK